MRFSLLCAVGSVALACGSTVTDPPKTPPCDEECKDSIAVRAVREMAKLAFNVTLQGKPVGEHDESRPCPLGGTVRVFGTATSNPIQGATEVRVTYVMTECGYNVKDDDALESYAMTLTGTLTQEGIIAVQPSATSALVMKSERMKMVGTVNDPPIPYDAECPLALGQNGNRMSGKVCGRETTVQL